jgi:hypothetical protein
VKKKRWFKDTSSEASSGDEEFPPPLLVFPAPFPAIPAPIPAPITKAIEIYSTYTGACPNPLCSQSIETCIKFKTNPNFLIMESVNSSEIITYNDLEKVMVIDNKRFRLICATAMINGNDLIAIFDFQNVNYYV